MIPAQIQSHEGIDRSGSSRMAQQTTNDRSATLPRRENSPIFNLFLPITIRALLLFVGNGAFGRLFIVLGSSSKQIYVAELVVQRIQGVQAIDGRCPANDIGLQMMSLFEP